VQSAFSEGEASSKSMVLQTIIRAGSADIEIFEPIHGHVARAGMHDELFLKQLGSGPGM
jgi:hypothetical protein